MTRSFRSHGRLTAIWVLVGGATYPTPGIKAEADASGELHRLVTEVLRRDFVDWDCSAIARPGDPSAAVQPAPAVQDWPALQRWLRAGFEGPHAISLDLKHQLAFQSADDESCPLLLSEPPLLGSSCRPPPQSGASLSEVSATAVRALRDVQGSFAACPLGLLSLRLRRWECALKFCGPASRHIAGGAVEEAWDHVLMVMPLFVIITSRWPVFLVILRIQALAPMWSRVADGEPANCSQIDLLHQPASSTPPLELQLAHCDFLRGVTAAARILSLSIGLAPQLVTAAENVARHRAARTGMDVSEAEGSRLMGAAGFVVDAARSLYKYQATLKQQAAAGYMAQATLHSLLLFDAAASRLFMSNEKTFWELTSFLETRAQAVVRALRRPGLVVAAATCLQCWPVFHILAALGMLAYRAHGERSLFSWLLGPHLPRALLPTTTPSPVPEGQWRRISTHLSRFFDAHPLDVGQLLTKTALVAVFFGHLPIFWLQGFIRRTKLAVRSATPLLISCEGAELCAACSAAAAEENVKDGASPAWLLCLDHSEEAAANQREERGDSPLVVEELHIALKYAVVLAILAIGGALAESAMPHVAGSPLDSSQHHCLGAPSGAVDIVVGEHFHARCLNAGAFYARSSAASITFFLRYLAWAHRWALGAEQSLLDAALNHSNHWEPFAPPEAALPGRSPECSRILGAAPTYRLLDVGKEFLATTGGVQDKPWFAGSGVRDVIAIHFITPAWKAAAAELFDLWAAASDATQVDIAEAEAGFKVELLLQRWHGAQPAEGHKPLCYSGRIDEELLSRDI